MPDLDAFEDRLREAARTFDESAARETIDELLDWIGPAVVPAGDEGSIERILGPLRSARFVDLLERTAKGLLDAGYDSPHATRQLCQAWIEKKELSLAIERLVALRDSLNPDHRERKEASGLLGRAHKQRYLDSSAGGGGDPGDLRAAIRHYRAVYDRYADEWWHGVNAAACLARAARDGVEVDASRDSQGEAEAIARNILGQIGELPLQKITTWDFATAAECAVALGRMDEAMTWIRHYVVTPDASAFELMSTRRQLLELWQLSPEKGEGGDLLTLLLGHIALLKGGEFELHAAELQALRATSQEPNDGLQKRFGAAGFITLISLLKGVEAARGVGRILDSAGRSVASGFLVRGSSLKADLGDELVLLTNAHAVSNDPGVIRQYQALRPDQVYAHFEATQGHWAADALPVTGLIDTSPPEVLDVSILRLDTGDLDRATREQPCSLGEHVPPICKGREPQVYVIGHPQGGALSFSLQDNVLIDHEVGPDAAPPVPAVRRLHYRAPTEPGSSGGPVLDMDWRVIGIHRRGKKNMEKLNGRPGTYEANEGVWVGSLRSWLA